MTQDTTGPEFLTVKELADLLRLKERKVYDLAASGAVPCSRATGKLLFPAREVRAWIASQSAGPQSMDSPRPPILLGSHDPLLDWAIRQSGCGLATFFDGSLDGLKRFRAGEGVAAALHVYEPDQGRWNIGTVQDICAGENAVLVGIATRQRGLVLRRDGPTVSGISDLPGLRLAPRQPDSGTDQLFRFLLTDAQIAPDALTLSQVARTETEAVQSVARGEADVTFGLETVARDFGLTFVPVIEERFDLLADRRAWFEPQMQRLMAFCHSEAFREMAERMGGYDLTSLGQIRWNA